MSARPFRRKVFYLPGYDPFPARRYRELYRRQARQQADISGYVINMAGPLPREGYGWQVTSTIEGRQTDTQIEVLIWSDLVIASRPKYVWSTYISLIRTAWIYLSTGVLWRLVRLRKGPVIAALYPVVALLSQLAIAALLGWAAFRLPEAFGWWDALPLRAAIGVFVAYVMLRWFQRNDGRFFAYYLMHDFSYSASQNGAYPEELEHRLHQFRDKVSLALDSDADEVLVVGHSSGAHLSISMLADLIRQREIAPDGPHLGLLTLGHVVPMVSFLPHGERLRADLRYLSRREELTWVDVTAPGDGCSFALCDPVSVSGQSTPRKRSPLVFSAAFTKSLSPARWRQLRWRFFRLHFQYLCAFDRPRDYDYFQITAGPVSLAERYRGRASSKSRLEKSVSKYTSVRP